MIKINNLTKYFNDFLVLDDVTCEFKPNYIYGLVGINGAGKSTFLRHLAGVYKQNSGEILYNDEPVFENNKAKKDIMFLSDSPSFFHNATINSMKKYYSTFYNFDEQLFLKLKDVFMLDINKSINEFSKGMKKQTELMLGLCCMPKVLILDETFDGLDPIISNKIKTLLIETIEEKEITIIVSSHNLTDLDTLCDYIYLLDNNKMKLQKDADKEENYYKIQLYFDNDELNNNIKENINLNILKESKIGSVTYLVVDGKEEDIREKILEHNPVLFEVLPFTFEEKFIYEYTGGE